MKSLTVLAICWGIAATWWVALPLGFSLACASRLGDRPKREPAELVRPLLLLLASMAATALIAGIAGWLLATTHVVQPDAWMVEHLAPRAQIPFLADAWAHSASYLSGLVGGIFLCIFVWHSRERFER